MAGLEIVDVTVDDGEWVLSLFRANKDVWPGGGSQEWWRYTHRSPTDRQRWVKVLVGGDRAGFAHWHRRLVEWANLYEIAVDARYRRAGVGRALVAYIGPPIVLKTRVDRQANGFYERLGFRHLGTETSRNGRMTFNKFAIGEIAATQPSLL